MFIVSQNINNQWFYSIRKAAGGKAFESGLSGLGIIGAVG
jgi:hypothetical protein